jgi:ABC-type antimicrobial peptide transport system permease subunit
VATDVQDVSLRAPVRGTMYLTQAQTPDLISNIRPTMPVFIARSTLDRGRLEQEITDAIRTVDPSLPAPDLFALSAMAADSMARERFGAVLVTLFGALALILTAIGIYSVLTYTVRSGRREIGIRMAVGASSNQVSRLVVIRGLRPIAIGIVAGVLGAVALSRFLESYLWGVAGTEPLALAAAAAGILCVAILACWIPAREAAAVDPVNVLSS